jgi:hypothetical protein
MLLIPLFARRIDEATTLTFPRRLAEGEGLEPTRPFGQRFSSPSTASSWNIVNVLWNPLLAGHKEGRDFLALPAVPICF